MDVDLATPATPAVTGFAGSFVHGPTGVGSGRVTVPLAAWIADPRFALAIFSLIDGVNAVPGAGLFARSIVATQRARTAPGGPPVSSAAPATD